LPALEARARILRAVRTYFEGQGFLEVETPLRVFSPGQEVHLEAVATEGGRFLITSPEYHMKRLVAAGAHRIYQIARAFRTGEQGPHHQPEFTLVEWYRAGEPLEAIAADCEALVRDAARATGRFPVLEMPSGQGPALRLQLDQPFERTTVRALFARHAGFELTGDEPAELLAQKARGAGVAVGAASAWDDLFFQVFLDRIEPRIGRERPTFVFDWPAPLAALARRKTDDPRLAERFELYAGGLELANAFDELTDPVEQRARFEVEAAVRRQRGKTVYPIDEKLLGALSRMPPTSGVALGLDRLVMLATGNTDIGDILAFPDDEV
jgi:elongation factor P--(R)-beta-lysine ligase